MYVFLSIYHHSSHLTIPCALSYYSRVGELEQENERLRALADGRSSSPARSSPSASEDSGSAEPQELQQLRTQLAMAKDRENELMRRLEASAAQVKSEPCDPTMSDSESSAESSPTLGPSSLIDTPSAKNATSLGLMVRSVCSEYNRGSYANDCILYK